MPKLSVFSTYAPYGLLSGEGLISLPGVSRRLLIASASEPLRIGGFPLDVILVPISLYRWFLSRDRAELYFFILKLDIWFSALMT